MATAKKVALKRAVKAVIKKAAARKAGVVLRKDGKPDRRFAKRTNSVSVNDGLAFSVRGRQLTITKNNRTVATGEVNLAGTNISCGVMQIYGVQRLENACREAGRSLAPGAVASLLTKIKNSSKAAFLIMSNNTNTPLINGVLDKICKVQTAAKPNPGTRRNIKVWVF